MGLIGADEDAAFERGDVTRVRLLASLERAGVDLDDLAAEVRNGRLSLRFAGQVMADPVGLTDASHGAALERVGLDPEFARRLQLALGLPAIAAGEPVREDDLELYGLVATALGSGLSDDALLRVMRVFGIAVRQIVEVQRELFRENVEERLLESGMEYPEMLEASAATRLGLQRIGYRTIFLLLRRFLEQAVFENLVARFEETLDAHHVRRSGEPIRTIAFADLTGYTRMTEEAGDTHAAEHGARLVEIAVALCAGSGGRLVKTLGDGVMLRFHEAGQAVAACLGLVEEARAAGLPPARVGIATGPVVQRDGDYFGRTVNLAARLVDAAEPGRVVASESVVAAAPERVFEPLGVRELQGVRDPVPVYGATRET